MQRLFPPVSEASTAGSTSSDTPAPQPESPAAEASEPTVITTPPRPFAWPPPEEDLDDWHVFQFGDQADQEANAPTVIIKPADVPTLKLVPGSGEPAAPPPVRPIAVEAPLAHLDLGDTAELSLSTPVRRPELGPKTTPIVVPFTNPATVPMASPFGTPDTAPVGTPLASPAAQTPAFTTPATVPMPAPTFTSPDTAPTPAPVFTTPATQPTSAPVFGTPATAPIAAPSVAADAPKTSTSSSAVTSLALSGALHETGTTVPARRTPPATSTGDPPLMSATVEVITRSAQQPTVRRPQTVNRDVSWLRRGIVIGLALFAIGEAAYIATLRLRAPVLAATTGALFVQSQPADADIYVDGTLRGHTPMRLDLPPGQHTLELRKDKVSRHFPLVIAAGAQLSQYVELRPDDAPPAPAPPAPAPAAAVTETPAVPAPRPVPTSGWLLVQSSIQLSVLRNGESIGNSDDGKLALGAGNQELELSNTAAGYREATTIRIQPGQITTLRPDLPQSTVDIDSTPTAKVSIDGREMGETPLAQVALTIGPHEIVFTHPDFPERRVTTFVKVATPAHVSADLSTP